MHICLGKRERETEIYFLSKLFILYLFFRKYRTIYTHVDYLYDVLFFIYSVTSALLSLTTKYDAVPVIGEVHCPTGQELDLQSCNARQSSYSCSMDTGALVICSGNKKTTNKTCIAGKVLDWRYMYIHFGWHFIRIKMA